MIMQFALTQSLGGIAGFRSAIGLRMPYQLVIVDR